MTVSKFRPLVGADRVQTLLEETLKEVQGFSLDLNRCLLMTDHGTKRPEAENPSQARAPVVSQNPSQAGSARAPGVSIDVSIGRRNP